MVTNRLFMAIGVVVLWAAITIGIGNIQTSGNVSLGEMVSSQLLWATPSAAAFLLIIVWLTRWNDLGLGKPKTDGLLKFIWLPLLYIAVFIVYAFTKDNSSLTPAVVGIVFINTMIVGFSEELAYRGILWGAARKTMAFWPAALLVSAMFGSVHIANGFLTGEFGEALVQAIIAGSSGFAYLAIRLRTASLWPILIIHGLWDFGIFMMGFGDTRDANASSSMLTDLAGGLGLVAPLVLFGFWLVRNEKVRGDWRSDSGVGALS